MRDRAQRLLAVWLLPNALTFIALALIRMQLIADTELGVARALSVGLAAGLLNDLSLSLLAPTAAALLAVLSIPPLATWTTVAVLAWGSTLAGALYYRFFSARLDLWVLRLHGADIDDIASSAAELMTTPLLAAATLTFGAALAVQWATRRQHAYRIQTSPNQVVPRLWLRQLSLALCLALLVVAAGKLAGPAGLDRNSTVLTDTPARWWLRQATRDFDYQRTASPDWEDRLAGGLAASDPKRARRTLAEFRSWGAPTSPSAPSEVALHRVLSDDPVSRRALRDDLGLPVDGPLNVIVLFLESTRAFELLSDDIGALILPGLRDILERHGILFTQAYTSAAGAGLTVRGQFSSECSMLPNIGGAATYIAHTSLEVPCLPALAADAGLDTIWLNTLDASFHRTEMFQALHGMQQFYDESYFAERIEERIGKWGLADGPFLLETVKVLSERAEGGRSFYANALTVSTHHPYTVIPEGPVPEILATRYADRQRYLGYLSRLRYLDRSLVRFFEAFVASPLAERTLIVLVGDHGAPVYPSANPEPAPFIEMRFRVPLALLSATMPNPRRITRPVHQIDIAPTVARLLGLRGTVPWVGRGLFANTATPWVTVLDGNLSYRIGQTACYQRSSAEPQHCYRVALNEDPMFANNLLEIPRDGAAEALARKVIDANLLLIATNAVMSR